MVNLSPLVLADLASLIVTALTLRGPVSSVAVGLIQVLTRAASSTHDAASCQTLMAVQFDGIERADVFVTLTDPRPARAVRELSRLPGVLAAEGRRIVPVRLRAGHRLVEPGTLYEDFGAWRRRAARLGGHRLGFGPGSLNVTGRWVPG